MYNFLTKLFLFLLVGNAYKSKSANFELKSNHFSDIKFTDQESLVLSDSFLNINLRQFKNFSLKRLIIRNAQKIIFQNESLGVVSLHIQEFIVSNVTFDIYLKNNSLSSQPLCLDANSQRNFWHGTKEIENLYLTDSVNYKYPICPIFLRDAHITNLYLFNISNNNKPRFLSSFDFDTTITNVFILNSNFKLNSELMDNFYKINSLSIINSSVIEIDENIFVSFLYLKHFYIELEDFSDFIRKTENKWLEYFGGLNMESNLGDCSQIINVNINKPYLNILKFITFKDLSMNYIFPDEDICLFKYFPHKHLVFPIIHTKVNIKCSCTLIWLIQNWKLKDYIESIYKNKENISMKTESIQDCFVDFESKRNKCYFEKKFKSCQINITIQEFYFNCAPNKNYHSPKCILRFSDIILIFFVGLFGLTSNSITLLVLFKANFKETFYSYLSMQIFFELVSTILFFLNVIIYSPVDFYSFYFTNSDICLLDYRLKNLELRSFKIYFMDFLIYSSITGNVLANFLMVLDRFLFISSNKSIEWFYKSKKIHKKLFLIIILFGLSLNINQLLVCVSPEDCLKNSSKIFNSNWIYLFQDLTFIFVSIGSLVINLFLINFIREYNLMKKKLRSFKLSNCSEKSIKKTLTMVILQCFTMVLSRIPDFMLSFYRLSIWNTKIEHQFSNYVSKIVLLEPFQINFLILIHLAFILNFFLYFLLDKKLDCILYSSS